MGNNCAGGMEEEDGVVPIYSSQAQAPERKARVWMAVRGPKHTGKVKG